MALKLIVGLGNPGREYEGTRHNVGFLFVQCLADCYTVRFCEDKKFKGRVGAIRMCGCDIRLLLPNTYMNLSGFSVSAIAKFYKIEPNDILIVHDDLDFVPGIIKFKKSGGHGGHNGLRSVTQSLGSDIFLRLRIGIGRPHDGDMVDYVLGIPSKSDKKSILSAIERGLSVVSDIVEGNFDSVSLRLKV